MVDYETLFLNYLASSGGLSKNTIEAYRNDLTKFNNYLIKLRKTVINVKTEDIESYLSDLHQQGFSRKTISREISALKHFYDFLQLENILEENPSTLIEHGKLEQKLPNFLTEDEIYCLFETAKADTSYHGIQTNCMLQLLYATGLRVSELVELTTANLEKKFNDSNNFYLENYLKVKGKGNKERIVPVNEEAIKCLINYLELREKLLKNNFSKWIFTTKVNFSRKNKEKLILNKADKHISRQIFAKNLKEIALKSNINPNKLSPHTIRHSIATHLLKNGADLKVIQEILGHSSITTTQIYTHIINEGLVKTVETLHPLAKTKDFNC